jgi:SH3 domain-containing protein
MSKYSTLVAVGVLSLSSSFAEDLSISPQEMAPIEVSQLTAPVVTPLPEVTFKPFTGKIKGKKVRLRSHPDLEGHVIRELSKNELISVVGEKNEFWAVEAPAGTKAYVFRSYILDNVVEGNRVNVRLHPDLEAPVIGHLNAGDHIDGVISALNNKWYEIPVPATTHFYVAKEYVDHIGGPEVKVQMDKRKQSVEQLLDAALLLSKAELRKTFEEIDLSRLSRNYQTIINEYADFPDYVDQAKEALTHLQESYLQKKIAFLEERANAVAIEEVIPEKEEPIAPTEIAKVEDPTERMKMWEPVEEAIYLSWARINEERSIGEFYDEQKLTAVALSGILEAYISPVKNKPGDFILRDKELPVAYLYSTTHNLQTYVGKKVRVIATPRENNNFAFPAYYVLSLE